MECLQCFFNISFFLFSLLLLLLLKIKLTHLLLLLLLLLLGSPGFVLWLGREPALAKLGLYHGRRWLRRLDAQ